MTSTRAGIITIGDELTSGDRIDTNSAWLSSQLTALGISIAFHLSLGDDLESIRDSVRESAQRVDYLIITGGLGPTEDDLSRAAVAAAAGDELITDEEALATLQKRFRSRGAELLQSNARQAQRPASFSTLANPLGTAPGLVGTIDRAKVFVVPGVPGEMKRLWNDHIAPAIQPDARAARPCHTTWVHAVARPESVVGKLLHDLMARQSDPIIGTLVHDLVVSVRIRSMHDDAAQRVAQVAAQVEQRLGPYVFARDEQTLVGALHDRLRARSQSLVTAESCTGGLLGSMLTEPPGASETYLGGWITYANRMKEDCLEVAPQTIEQQGAVSGLTADQMAIGALTESGATYALSITGIAGPGGSSEHKPVGTVFIALAFLDEDGEPSSHVRRFRIAGDRSMIRARSAMSALAMLHFHLTNDGVIPDMTFGDTTPAPSGTDTAVAASQPQP